MMFGDRWLFVLPIPPLFHIWASGEKPPMENSNHRSRAHAGALPAPHPDHRGAGRSLPVPASGHSDLHPGSLCPQKPGSVTDGLCRPSGRPWSSITVDNPAKLGSPLIPPLLLLGLGGPMVLRFSSGPQGGPRMQPCRAEVTAHWYSKASRQLEDPGPFSSS